MAILDHLALPTATLLLLASAFVVHNYQIPSELASISDISNLATNYLGATKTAIIAHIKDPAILVDTISSILDTIFVVDTKGTGASENSGKRFSPNTQAKFDKLTNPPTRTAILAWVLFVLSAQYIHEMNQKNRYQTLFLITGIVFGFVSSITTAFVNEQNIFVLIKSLVPGSVAVSLVLSSLVHRFGLVKQVEKEKKDQ